MGNQSPVQDDWADLEGRTLVWSTTANVPIAVQVGGEGYGLLQIMGVPRMLRPWDLKIGRNPVRDEFNVAVMRLTADGSGGVRFLTENYGNWLHIKISEDGGYVVATREDENSQNIGRFDLSTGEMEPVAFSHAYDRWPGCTSDGSIVLFHSFRDGNPAGDLYLAVDEGDENWRIVRLTDSADREYVWPGISSDGSTIVAVERNLGADAGRIIKWPLEIEVVGDPVYVTEEMGDYRFPSLNGDGSFVCRQSKSGEVWRLWLKKEGEEVRMIVPPDSEGYEWLDMVQPSITADGRYIVFIEDHQEYGEDRIGIYDVLDEKYMFLEGCEGSVMMPSLSDPPDTGEEYE